MLKNQGQILETESLVIGFRKSNRSPYVLFTDISVKAGKGELIAIIGQNGIGKSTLIKTLVRLLKPLSGKILVGGTPINDYSRTEFSRLVGYVSTEIIKVGNLTVTDMVSFGRFPYTNWLGRITNKDTEIILSALEMVGLQNLRHKNIAELSDGERQRAMIARSVAQDTEILILDEPTAFLDLPNRHDVLHLLGDLARKHSKTIIFSTHDLSLVINEADKIWMMTETGMFQGTPEDMALNNSFDRLFPHSAATFDIESGRFLFPPEFHRPLKLIGEGKVLFWTCKALERKGFLVNESDKTDIIIHAFEENGKFIWKLTKNDVVEEFNSICELLQKVDF